MSIIDMDSKIKELRELRRMADELTAEMESITDSIKRHMDAEGVDTLNGTDWKVTYKEAAQYWFSVAEQNGHAYAGYFLDRMERQEDLPPPNILLSATRLLHHMGNIFRDNAPQPTAPTGIQIDRKRLQRLREKKMAMGHKWNDRENEQSHGMGGL